MNPATFKVDDSHQSSLWLRRFHLNVPVQPLPDPIIGTLHTSPNSKTKAARLTQQAVDNRYDGLNSLFYGGSIWQRLWAYISPEPYDTPIAGQEPNVQYKRIWDCPGANPNPPASYEGGQTTLRNITSTNAGRNRPLLVNNFSAKDAVDRYIYDPLDEILKMRYDNRATEFKAEAPFRNTSDRSALTDNEVEESVFFPGLTRVLLSHHRVQTKETSGYTDKLLSKQPREREKWETSLKDFQSLISEAKTPWSYNTDQLSEIFTGHNSILKEDGSFQKSSIYETHGGNALLKQLWGQCASLGPDVGFTTNMEYVLIVIRIYPSHKAEEPEASGSALGQRTTRSATKALGPPKPELLNEESGFIVSPLMKWTDPRLLTCLTGLCMMAIDEDAWVEKIQDMLCPEAERHRIQHNPLPFVPEEARIDFNHNYAHDIDIEGIPADEYLE